MARADIAYLSFNRGLVDRRGIARMDVKRLALAASTMKNWVAQVLGSMTLRPGLKYTGAIAGSYLGRQLAFVRSLSTKATIELTDLLMRVWVDDALVTRVSVSTAVANGDFDTALTSWTDNDESGATSVWVSGGYMGLTGTGTLAAIRDQTVTVAAADVNLRHALRIVVQRGPVVLRVGTSTSDDSYISETTLGTGTHSLAFSPAGNFNIRFLSRLERQVLVTSCNVESSGVMTIPTPWAYTDLKKIAYNYQYLQSVDVMFIPCEGYAQQKIERRAADSWSLVLYEPEDGPFMTENVSPTTLTPSGLEGNITLTASAALFKPEHAPSALAAPGALFTITSEGQTVDSDIAAENTFTATIEVTGVDSARSFSISLTGTWVATVTLQRSFDEGTSWIDVTSYTTNQAITYDDGLDNQIILYRIGIKTGNYTSGTVTAILAYALGSIRGVARVTSYTSATVVSAEVLKAFGGTDASDIWSEGSWSRYRGYPSAGGLYEGRLWWFGKDRVDGSISDAFDGFDPDFEGDAGPIQRSIGSGPVENFKWALPLQRLIAGGEGAEFSCRSSALDQPLTPTNFGIKASSNQGSADAQAEKIDSNGIFVQRGGFRVFEIAFAENGIDYESVHISALVPKIGDPGIIRMAAARQPDTRVHFVRSDGTVAFLTFDKLENVICWCEIETDGDVEDVCILPGSSGAEEDEVYYIVARTVGGATVRYREKWALESECTGQATTCKLADSFVVFTNTTPSATVTGLSHLEGLSVVAWADGEAMMDASDANEPETFTVTGGSISLTQRGTAFTASSGVVGLAYTAKWETAKLAQLQAMVPVVINKHGKIDGLGLLMDNVHPKGLKYGPTFATADLQNLPEIEQGTTVDADTVRAEYDEPTFEFPGTWTVDSRICLQGQAPLPVTVLAFTAPVEVT